MEFDKKKIHGERSGKYDKNYGGMPMTSSIQVSILSQVKLTIYDWLKKIMCGKRWKTVLLSQKEAAYTNAGKRLKRELNSVKIIRELREAKLSFKKILTVRDRQLIKKQAKKSLVTTDIING